jgi:phage replication initiation protein
VITLCRGRDRASVGVWTAEKVPTDGAFVDWCEWTEFARGVDDVCAELVGDDGWVESDRGGLGYRRARVTAEGVWIFYDGQVGMGVHVRASGRACRALEEVGWVPEWGSRLRWMGEEGRALTRLDVAIDDTRGLVTPEKCETEAKDGRLVTRFRDWHPEPHYNGLGELQSETVYFGSRKSDLCVRVYDKAKEQGLDDVSWTRVELQARDERAAALAVALSHPDAGARTRAFCGVLLSYLDFKVAGGDSHRDRWVTAEWWSTFLDGVVKNRLQLPGAVMPTVEEALAAVLSIYGPQLAAVAETVGWGELVNRVSAQRIRWRSRHRARLLSWGAHIGENAPL